MRALLSNPKLPVGDHKRVAQALDAYNQWIADITHAVRTEDSAENCLRILVRLLNDYKFGVDVHLIFDSDDDFLYRQGGQLKLSSSVLEEFLPLLTNPKLLPKMKSSLWAAGPATCLSGLMFETLQGVCAFQIRTKDQDFAIYTERTISTCSLGVSTAQQVTIRLASVATECKTNLDKTMFQEACATASDIKGVVSGARYFVLCEWLDMTPIATAGTPIDEVIILRKGKRISAELRANFNHAQGRRSCREQYIHHLRDHPFQVELFARFLEHIRQVINGSGHEALKTGFF